MKTITKDNVATKVRAALRRLDKYTDAWKETRDRAKHPTRKKWFICELGKEETPFIKVDHIVPVGVLKGDLSNLSDWAQRLFVPASQRQAICDDCHDPKTKKDLKEMRKKK